MTWIRTVGEEEATGPLKDLYDQYRARMGTAANIIQATSLRPDATLALEAFRRTVFFGGSRLGRRREEMIAVVTSSLLKCTY